MKLKEIYRSQGYSVPKLAAASGVPRRTIQDIEKRGDCLVSTAKKLSDALGVTIEELFGFDKE